MSCRRLSGSLPLCFLVLCFIPVRAQDTLLVSSLKGGLPLWKTGAGAFLHSNSGNSREVLNQKDWQSFNVLPEKVVGGYYWLHLVVKNDLTDSAYVDFVALRADTVVLYKIDQVAMPYQMTGSYVGPSEWIFPEYPELAYILCGPAETSEILIRLSASRGIGFSPNELYVQSRFDTLSEVVEGYRVATPRIEFNGFFLGGICVMMVFFFFLYFWMNEKALLFYSIYLLGAACYAIVVKSLPYSQLARLAYLNYELTYKLGEPVQYLFFAAYAWFGKHLLDIDKRYGMLFYFLRGMALTLVFVGIVLLLVNLTSFNYFFQEKVFVWIRMILFPVVLTLSLWVAIVVKSPVKWFFLVGSSFFILGGLVAFLMDPKSRSLFFGSTYINPVLVFKSGILLESVCFALALGYKLRAIRIEKENATDAYIEQMELNRQLTATENERLEQMVKERTDEIIEKNTLLEKQKQRQLESEYEKQLSEMEMQALRSQMNPHFIFNSLNSIRHQILTKNYENASIYLVRFARLLRKILHNSREHVIPLSEEIDLISLYLQLEKLRFGDLFEYDIAVAPGLDTEGIVIPSMLLQPFVENGLKHGIASSQRLPRRLDIHISEMQSGFRYEIEDNGIGREAALKRKSRDERTGLGLKITNERIALFNASYDQKISVVFEDLKDETGQPLGTKVVVSHLSDPLYIA